MRTWKALATGACAAAAILFCFVAGNLIAGDRLAPLDVRIAVWLHAHTHPALTLLMLAVTYAHGALALCTYSAALGIFLARRGEGHWVLGVGLAVPAGLLINVALKHLFQRVRPVFEEPLLFLTTYSFPSGHTAGTTLFYGVVTAYVFSRTRNTRVRIACVAGWAAAVVLVGFSRMYLGVHYLTDVVAAAAWSLIWLALCTLAVHRLQARLARRPSS